VSPPETVNMITHKPVSELQRYAYPNIYRHTKLTGQFADKPTCELVNSLTKNLLKSGKHYTIFDN